MPAQGACAGTGRIDEHAIEDAQVLLVERLELDRDRLAARDARSSRAPLDDPGRKRERDRQLLESASLYGRKAAGEDALEDLRHAPKRVRVARLEIGEARAVRSVEREDAKAREDRGIDELDLLVLG